MIDIGNIISDLPDKSDFKNTTTHLFKQDLVEYFSADVWRKKTCVEIGSAWGHTSRVLSFLFSQVYCLDWRDENIKKGQMLNSDRENINWIHANAYNIDWSSVIPIKFDVAFIDCVHDKLNVVSDINNAIKYGSDDVVLIFDDYGHPRTGVKSAISDMVNNKVLIVDKFIGAERGTKVSYYEVIDWEGVICKKVI